MLVLARNKMLWVTDKRFPVENLPKAPPKPGQMALFDKEAGP